MEHIWQSAEPVAVWIFWISLAVISYTYFGYPLLLIILATLRRRPVRKGAYTPTLSIIIPNYNEKTKIAHKLDNTLDLDYPGELLEIIVASDCSTDGSDEIVAAYAERGVKAVRLAQRQGKHRAQGRALEVARGEIIVFTDVSIQLPEDTLQTIVANFADPAVQCVSSVDRTISEDNVVNTEGLYIRYDMFLRRYESLVGSATGMSGSCYAARRSLCDNWLAEMSNDFYMPLLAVLRGGRAVLDPQVIGYYRLVGTYREELARKVRTIVHGLQVLFHFTRLLNPGRYGLFSLQLISHKLLRWLVPFFLIAALGSNVVLIHHGLVYQLFFAVQVVLYLAAALGGCWPAGRKLWPLRIAYFFAMANLAILIAWYKYLSGQMYTTWEPSRR
jgi:glycosyltransferase involved in cell wall biosynthesis